MKMMQGKKLSKFLWVQSVLGKKRMLKLMVVSIYLQI